MFLDIVDILTYIDANITKPSKGSDLIEPWYKIVDIAETPCSKVINFSKRNKTLMFDINDSIQKVIDNTTPANHHRVAITKDKTFISMLTQSNLLEFLFKNSMWENMGNLAWQTIRKLNLGLKKVYTVTPGTQVLQAFHQIVKKQVSALAIVDNDGHLIGNLSASDLKATGYDMELYSKIFGTVDNFIKSNVKPVSVTPDTTFKEVLGLFHSKKVHRLWITENKSLVGVISPNDILECFRSHKALPSQEVKNNSQER